MVVTDRDSCNPPPVTSSEFASPNSSIAAPKGALSEFLSIEEDCPFAGVDPDQFEPVFEPEEFDANADTPAFEAGDSSDGDLDDEYPWGDDDEPESLEFSDEGLRA